MVVQYSAWRIIAGLNDSIELSFMLVGHTKFAPDCWIFKRLYRRSLVDTMTDIVCVMKESSSSGKPNLLSLPWDLERFIGLTGHTSFTASSSLFQALLLIHHFKVSKAGPGIVTVKECKFSRIFFEIFKKDVNEVSLGGQRPDTIIPSDLDAKRQWYLYDEIRPFCSTNLAKDMTRPKPSVPRPGSAPQPKKSQKRPKMPTHI